MAGQPIPDYGAFAGNLTTGNVGTTTVAAAATQTGAGGAPIRNDTFSSGAAAGLTNGQLGTGGNVTTNIPGTQAPPQDGSQILTFNYGAFGVAALIAPFLNGDQVQFQLQATDASNGDPSPISTTAINIGQPPTVTSLAGTPANSGAPTFTFLFNAGAGGGAEQTWQLTVKLAGVLVFDSAVHQDQLNTVMALIAPLMLSASGYTVLVTVTSTDTPINGTNTNGGASSDTGTQTITWTPSYTAPATPTTVSATPSASAGNMLVQWTNPGGSAANLNNIYYRVNGTTPWFLLFKDVVAVIGSAQTKTLYDQLAFNTAYDFAVTAKTSTHATTTTGTNGAGSKTLTVTSGTGLTNGGRGAAQ